MSTTARVLTGKLAGGESKLDTTALQAVNRVSRLLAEFTPEQLVALLPEVSSRYTPIVGSSDQKSMAAVIEALVTAYWTNKENNPPSFKDCGVEDMQSSIPQAVVIGKTSFPLRLNLKNIVTATTTGTIPADTKTTAAEWIELASKMIKEMETIAESVANRMSIPADIRKNLPILRKGVAKAIVLLATTELALKVTRVRDSEILEAEIQTLQHRLAAAEESSKQVTSVQSVGDGLAIKAAKFQAQTYKQRADILSARVEDLESRVLSLTVDNENLKGKAADAETRSVMGAGDDARSVRSYAPSVAASMVSVFNRQQGLPPTKLWGAKEDYEFYFKHISQNAAQILKTMSVCITGRLKPTDFGESFPAFGIETGEYVAVNQRFESMLDLNKQIKQGQAQASDHLSSVSASSDPTQQATHFDKFGMLIQQFEMELITSKDFITELTQLLKNLKHASAQSSQESQLNDLLVKHLDFFMQKINHAIEAGCIDLQNADSACADKCWGFPGLDLVESTSLALRKAGKDVSAVTKAMEPFKAKLGKIAADADSINLLADKAVKVYRMREPAAAPSSADKERLFKKMPVKSFAQYKLLMKQYDVLVRKVVELNPSLTSTKFSAPTARR